ncbi:MAG: hypothetical protein LBM77_01255 [Spirochaetaceae bacterium]|jgi:hypothetical protein|nr:hypothetical protein [Spirochaetaceae bacterium]
MFYKDIEIIFKQSAFGHEQTEEDIAWAFRTAEYDEYVVGSDDQFRLLGFNTKGNLIEVMYNEINDHKINVFHAMPCQNRFLELIINNRRSV